MKITLFRGDQIIGSYEQTGNHRSNKGRETRILRHNRQESDLVLELPSQPDEVTPATIPLLLAFGLYIPDQNVK